MSYVSKSTLKSFKSLVITMFYLCKSKFNLNYRQNFLNNFINKLFR